MPGWRPRLAYRPVRRARAVRPWHRLHRLWTALLFAALAAAAIAIATTAIASAAIGAAALDPTALAPATLDPAALALSTAHKPVRPARARIWSHVRVPGGRGAPQLLGP